MPTTIRLAPTSATTAPHSGSAPATRMRGGGELRAEREGDVLAHDRLRPAGEADQSGHGTRVVAHDGGVGHLDRGVAPCAAHGDAQARGCQRWRVVDTVADHRQPATQADSTTAAFSCRQQARADVVDADVGLRRLRLRPRCHRSPGRSVTPQAAAASATACRGLGPHRVGEADQTDHLVPRGRPHDCLTVVLQPPDRVGQVSRRAHRRTDVVRRSSHVAPSTRPARTETGERLEPFYRSRLRCRVDRCADDCSRQRVLRALLEGRRQLRAALPRRQSTASTATTAGRPSVSVPVLSNATPRIAAACSRCAPPLTSTPAADERPSADTIATGVEITSAHGQARMSRASAA